MDHLIDQLYPYGLYLLTAIVLVAFAIFLRKHNRRYRRAHALKILFNEGGPATIAEIMTAFHDLNVDFMSQWIWPFGPDEYYWNDLLGDLENDDLVGSSEKDHDPDGENIETSYVFWLTEAGKLEAQSIEP